METQNKLEIERRFLVKSFNQDGLRSLPILQGYMSKNPAIRVRMSPSGAYVTFKEGKAGAARAEYEYPIPADDVDGLLQFCYGKIEKTRYFRPHGKHVWEIDVFHGANDGLVIAEIELTAVDEDFTVPDDLVLGEEVTQFSEYSNASLASKTPI